MKMSEENKRILLETVSNVLSSMEEIETLSNRLDNTDLVTDLEDAKSYAVDASSEADKAMTAAEKALDTVEDVQQDIRAIQEEIKEVQAWVHTIMDIIEPFLPKSPLEVLEKFVKNHRGTIRGMYFDSYVDRGPFDGIICAITRVAEIWEVKLDLDAIDRKALEEITLELSPA